MAYLFDPSYEPRVAEMIRVRQSREQRAERMVEQLRAGGIDLAWAEVHQLADGATVGRPHVAQALLRHRHIASVAEAFTPRWLGERYDVAKQELEVFTALRLVRAAGGVAALANSRRGDRVVPDELIAQLADAGLFGLEADHPEHDTATRAQVRARAANLGLVVTGSSDFHGPPRQCRSLPIPPTRRYTSGSSPPPRARPECTCSAGPGQGRENRTDLAPGEEGRRRRCLWSS